MTPPTARPFLLLALIAAAPALGACASSGPAAPAAQAAPQEQQAQQEQEKLTRAEAAEQCWMSVEKKDKGLSLDKRADIVTKCIDDKLGAPAAEAGPQQPKAPKSKT
jgi:hypothetical protein